jgi:hypothetical protein
MQIGIGLPNQVRNVRADLIPGWAGRAEEAGFSTLGTVGRYAYPGLADLSLWPPPLAQPAGSG